MLAVQFNKKMDFCSYLLLKKFFQKSPGKSYKAQVSCHIWDPLTPHFCWYLANFFLVTTLELFVVLFCFALQSTLLT